MHAFFVLVVLNCVPCSEVRPQKLSNAFVLKFEGQLLHSAFSGILSSSFYDLCQAYLNDFFAMRHLGGFPIDDIYLWRTEDSFTYVKAE